MKAAASLIGVNLSSSVNGVTITIQRMNSKMVKNIDFSQVIGCSMVYMLFQMISLTGGAVLIIKFSMSRDF